MNVYGYSKRQFIKLVQCGINLHTLHIEFVNMNPPPPPPKKKKKKKKLYKKNYLSKFNFGKISYKS